MNGGEGCCEWRRAKRGSGGCRYVEGVGMSQSPQSPSPMARPMARPPGHARSGPAGCPPCRAARATLPPPLMIRRASSVFTPHSSSRCDVVRWSGWRSAGELPCEKPYANESPTLPHVIVPALRQTATTVAVEPWVGLLARISACRLVNATVIARSSSVVDEPVASETMRPSNWSASIRDAFAPPWPSATRARRMGSAPIVVVMKACASSPFFEATHTSCVDE